MNANLSIAYQKKVYLDRFIEGSGREKGGEKHRERDGGGEKGETKWEMERERKRERDKERVRREKYKMFNTRM